MSEQRLDPMKEARDALQVAVRDYGVDILGNPELLNNLFKDLLADAPRESSLLVAAADAGVAGLLQEQVNAGLDPDAAVRLTAATLADRRALDPAACAWAVAEIGRALGLAVSEASAAPRSAMGAFGASATDLPVGGPQAPPAWTPPPGAPPAPQAPAWTPPAGGSAPPQPPAWTPPSAPPAAPGWAPSSGGSPSPGPPGSVSPGWMPTGAGSPAPSPPDWTPPAPSAAGLAAAPQTSRRRACSRALRRPALPLPGSTRVSPPSDGFPGRSSRRRSRR